MALDFQIPDAAYEQPTGTLDFWIRNLIAGAPIVTPATFEISEDAAIGAVVGTVEAADPNGDDFEFFISSGNTGGAFAIDSETGEITVAAALDYETKTSYSLVIGATDTGELTGTETITINVLDVEEPELEPAPNRIHRTGLPWGTLSARDRASHLAWTVLRGLDLGVRLPFGEAADLGVSARLPWRDLPAYDVATGLRWGDALDPPDAPTALTWIQLPALDRGATMPWDDSQQPTDQSTALAWLLPPSRDLGVRVIFDDVDLHPPAGAWFSPPEQIQSGGEIVLEWSRPLDFRIRVTDTYSQPVGTLDFNIPAIDPDPDATSPVLLLWAPFRAEQVQPIPIDTPIALPWQQLPWRDRIVRLPWGPGSPVPGGEVTTPWENEPPEPTWIVVPPLRVYNVSNSITVVRLPERTPLDPLAVTLSYDDESFAWRVQLTLFSATQAALLSPVSGVKEVEININGFTLVAAIEDYSRERRFPRTTWTAQGRSRQVYLDEPYTRPRSYISDSLASAEQHALAELPGGWTLDWDVPDWVIPAGAWSYDQLTPIRAIARLAAAAGAIVQPDPEDKHIVVRSRYPTSPGDWASETLYASLPDALCTRMGSSYQPGQARNQVIVEGATQGVRVICTRTGTAGDDPLPSITDQVCTAVECGMERGRVELDATGATIDESIAIPILPSPGVILPGKLLEITDGGSTWRGMTRGIEITAARTQQGIAVGQTLRIERRAS